MENDVTCHGKVMEFYHKMSVETLCLLSEGCSKGYCHFHYVVLSFLEMKVLLLPSYDGLKLSLMQT